MNLMLELKKEKRNNTKSFRRKFPRFKDFSKMPTNSLTLAIDSLEEKNKKKTEISKYLMFFPLIFGIILLSLLLSK